MTLQEVLNLIWDQIFVILYLATWIISVYRYRRFFDTPLKFFPMIIMYTFFNEILGYFITYSDQFQFFSDSKYTPNNIVIYNIYQVVFFVYIFDVYRKILKSDQLKKLVFYLIIAWVFGYLVNGILVNPLIYQTTYAHIFGSVLMVLISLMYLREKLNEESSHPLKFNLMFWVTIGLLAFYIPFPLILTFYKIKAVYGIWIFLKPILVTSIILMYGFIIFGLLIGKRRAFRWYSKTTYTSLPSWEAFFVIFAVQPNWNQSTVH